MTKVGQALAELPKGKIVLDAPTEMKVGDVRAIYANVGIKVPIEALRKHSRTTGQSIENALSISSEMMATLTGPGFRITPSTPEQQSVAEGFPTVWSWDIEARQEGEQELEATLYVLLPSGDKSIRQRIDSFTHKIGVTVREQTWADSLKSWRDEIDAVKTIGIAVASAVTGIVGWMGWLYSRRRRNGPKEAPVPPPSTV
jgi:hypothetical protein